ncbi:UNVERIFIED_CONTAM: Peroxidase 4 [Sesamum latifolium]|uniref:Peroxidase n=1 Tax=Sesamum latifolium TaxID=2727402 RepID=A0AAW2T9S6_9LAMI
MASFPSCKAVITLAILLVFLSTSSAQLSPDFYSKSCPNLFATVKSVVHSAIQKEARMGASLLRLFFHDCFVNFNFLPRDVMDRSSWTTHLRSPERKGRCRIGTPPGDLMLLTKSRLQWRRRALAWSPADVLAIAARDSVVILGGPDWNVKLGRRDARTASRAAANNGIPPPTSNLNALISRFNALGLSTKDLVALSGSHTIGQARCTSFRARIYNESNLDTSLAQTRKGNCPRASGVGDNNLAPLDLQTPTNFDNNYFKNLVSQRGLLHSDQQLFNGGGTDSIVRTYSNDPNTFKSDFAAAMLKMGDIRPLTGSNGEVRKNCRRVN